MSLAKCFSKNSGSKYKSMEEYGVKLKATSTGSGDESLGLSPITAHA